MRPNTQPNAQPAKPGLTGKQKVVLLAGAALLFYLYKRYQVAGRRSGADGGAGAHPQLYREDKGPNKGAIYYRKNDANHTVVWLQAPAQGVQVPADQVQQASGRTTTQQPERLSAAEQVNTNPADGVNGGTVQSGRPICGRVAVAANKMRRLISPAAIRVGALLCRLPI